MFCPFCAYNAVPMHFGRVEVSRTYRCIPLIFEKIASGCDSDAVRIFFLWLVVNGGICVSEKLSRRQCMSNLIACHDKHCVHSFLTRLIVALCYAAKVLPNAVCHTSAVAGSFINCL